MVLEVDCDFKFVKNLEEVSSSMQNEINIICSTSFRKDNEISIEEAEEIRDGRRVENFRIGFLIALCEEKVVGVTELYYASSFICNKIIKIGGIAGVAVDKKKRRLGIGSGMVRKAIYFLKKFDADIIFLYTDGDKESWRNKFYVKLGFKNLVVPYFFRGRSGRFYKENNGMISGGNRKDILEEILLSKEPLYLNAGRW